MDSIRVERLGEVAPFRDTDSWVRSKAVEPTPIILWRGDQVAAALYYRWKGNSILSSFEQEIGSMEKSPRVPLGSAFPIRFSGRVSGDRGESALPGFDVAHLQVADVDGDGTDELVLPRHLGGVEVYNLRGLTHRGSVPQVDPKHFSYEVVLAHKARVEGKDRVYFIFHREPHKGVEAPKASPSPASPDTIIEVSGAGVRVISLNGLPAEVAEIAGLGLRNRPGSKEFDELLVLSRLQGKTGLFLSRHDTQGKLLGEARLVYADVGGQQRFDFAFLPQSDLAVAVGNSLELAMFLWPDKPANWVKTVRVANLGTTPMVRGFVDRKSANPKALVQAQNWLYVLDADGVSYGSQGGQYVPMEKTEPWVLTTASRQHRLAQVRLLDGDDNAFLVIDACEEGERELSLSEAREAAAQFLLPEFVAEVEEARRLTFEKLYDERTLMAYGAKRGIQDPLKVIQTLEDIQRLIPEYYKRERSFSEGALAVDLSNRLLRPIRFNDVPAAEPAYRNIPEFRKWLAGIRMAPEVRFRIFHGLGNPVFDRSIREVGLFRLGSEPGIPPRWVAAKYDGARVRLVLPLERGDERGVVATGFNIVRVD